MMAAPTHPPLLWPYPTMAGTPTITTLSCQDTVDCCVLGIEPIWCGTGESSSTRRRISPYEPLPKGNLGRANKKRREPSMNHLSTKGKLGRMSYWAARRKLDLIAWHLRKKGLKPEFAGTGA